MSVESEVKNYLDEERKQQSSPFITGSHNFKIDMKLFMHEVANCVRTNKQFALVYKILKDIDGGNTVVLNNPGNIVTLGTTKKTYYAFIKRLEATDLVKRVNGFNGQRGYVKYVVNPRIIYNYRKCKSNRTYSDNCMYWDIM